MAGILNAQNNIAASFPALDQYGPNTTLLLHGDGTNGAQNNTFLDSSANNFTITRNGNTTQGTFSPFSQPNGYWSNYFNGTSSYLNVASNAAFGMGTGDFTVEAWIYTTGFSTTGSPDYNMIFDFRTAGNQSAFLLAYNNTYAVYSFDGPNSNVWGGSGKIAVNQWNHVALTRSSGTWTIWINGNSYNTLSSSSNLGSSQPVYIGTAADNPGNTRNLLGYISNIRVIKGTAIYTSNFTVPTTPLTAISGTSLLTCQSNYFKDNSTNAFTVTASGSPTVQAFKPFSAPTAYYPAVNGGAGYFDGSGDYLSVADNAALEVGSSNFTVEAWVYLSSASQANGSGIISKPASSSYSPFMIGIYPINGGLSMGFSSSGSTWNLYTYDSTPFTLNTWAHVAAVRNGDNFTLYKNGISVATGTLSGALWDNTESLKVGWLNYASTYWPGYITNARLVIGTAVYTSNFTPPTAPLTAISNTQFLCNCQNAGIIDSVSQNQVETIGSAQISTTQSKFGASSMYFAGNGGVVNMTAQQTKSIGSGDFTVEFWMYPTSSGATQGLCCLGNYPGAFAGEMTMYYNVSSNSRIYLNFAYSNNYTTNISVSLNTWTHVAVSRSNGILRIFINGNLDTSVSNTDVINTTGFSVGQPYPNLNQEYFTGYIDDFRLTTGVGRYTKSFTPPQNAYPNYGPLTNIPTVDPNFKNTTLLLHGNGTNGAQNNTFLDSSTNNFTITRNGNTTQGTFTPFSQPNGWWSNNFNYPTTSDYINIPSSSLFNFSSGDWTIEGWFYSQSNLSGSARYFTIFSTYTNPYGLIPGGSGNAFLINIFGNGSPLTSIYAPELNTWQHIALVNYSGTTTLYVNGIASGSASSFMPNSDCSIQVGGCGGTYAYGFQGYISNFRVVKSAVYTSNFTPSAMPLTPISNTAVLTCQSNKFVDNSSNSFAITTSGSPTVQNFYPFFPPLDYSTAAIGGSAYFDGSGDYLSMTSGTSLGSGDFTISCWVYLTSAPASETPAVCSSYNYYTSGFNGNFVARVSTDNLWRSFDGQSNQATINGSFSWSVNTWYYVAWVRSGSTVTVYRDGVSLGSVTDSKTLSDTANGYVVGSSRVTGSISNNFPGYISNFRVVVGSAITSVPTTTSTAITNTSLLLSATNGGIFDNASKNDLETVGNAQISTTQSKFGGSSMYFDGSGDSLYSTASQTIAFGTGDFTFECWIYLNTLTSSYQTLLTSSTTNAVYADFNNTYIDFGRTNTAADLTVTYTLPTSAWFHFAVTRSSSTMRMFVNGNQIGSATVTSNYPASNFYISATFSSINGYIDDLRITNGVSRYNYNFTPPAAPFPNK